MISDTIFDALTEIEDYLAQYPSIYQDEDALMIHELCKHMRKVMNHLDTPPKEAGQSKPKTGIVKTKRKPAPTWAEICAAHLKSG